MTPHLLIDAAISGVVVPEQYIDDGKIILNISPSAIHEAQFGNDWILFSARFNGALFRIELPMESVIAIYAKENGRGMVFPESSQLENTEVSDDEQSDNGKPRTTEKPHLTVVK